MKQVIHIFGASGSGTSTLGSKIAKEMGYTQLDIDDYFWMPTDPKFTTIREREERIRLLQEDIDRADNVVLSGAFVGWGDVLIPQFTLAIRIVTDQAVRLERLEKRERERFGGRLDPSGDMYKQHLEFMDWAAAYDDGDAQMRSKAQHDQWEKLLTCKQITLDGAGSLENNFQIVKETIIYQMIQKVALDDDRIQAVYMNGSRTNPNVPRDIFQDYDIVYAVNETKSFIEDKEWIHQFGEIAYMQYPDESPFYPSDKEHSYAWLVQFKNGVRIDLSVKELEYAKKHILEDKLCKILLDKNHILPSIPESSDSDYYVHKPTREEYLACCNEFWWCSNNVGKGLWREEIPYVQEMTNMIVRKQLEYMLSWKVGIKTDFSVSVGKCSKYLYKWLSEDEYAQYLSTYFSGEVSKAWEAIFRMCDLFEAVAQEVGEQLGFRYDEVEGREARKYLEYCRNLPKEDGIYANDGSVDTM